MRAGQITVTSQGTLQGAYRPQMRVYYENARHGVLYETITKPIRCRSRKRAIDLGREWRESDEGKAALADVFLRLAQSDENAIPKFTE